MKQFYKLKFKFIMLGKERIKETHVLAETYEIAETILYSKLQGNELDMSTFKILEVENIPYFQ